MPTSVLFFLLVLVVLGFVVWVASVEMPDFDALLEQPELPDTPDKTPFPDSYPESGYSESYRLWLIHHKSDYDPYEWN